MSAADFWDMTYAEIKAVIDGYNTRKMDDTKLQAYLNYNLAVLMNRAFAGKMPDLYEAYPTLFEEEAKEAALRKFKAYMIDYAEHAKGGENG